MLDTILRRLENTLIAVTFLFITLLTFTNVIARYVFRASFSFTVELVVNLAVLLTMVGAAAATRLGTHPSFSLLRDRARGVPRRVIVIAISAGVLTFYVVFLWLGFDMAIKQFASGRLTPALQIPQWIFSMGLPFGALLGAIRTVQVAVLDVRSDGSTKTEETEALAAAGLVVSEDLSEAPTQEPPVARDEREDDGPDDRASLGSDAVDGGEKR